MKLLILTCLVAAAMAMPNFSFKHSEISQSQQDSSSEEILKEDKIFKFVQPTSVEIRKQTELLREKQSEEIKDTSNDSTEEALADSEEVVPSNAEQMHTPGEDMLYQLNLEAGCAQPSPQVYQLDTYPFAAWYYPQVQYLSFSPFLDNTKPIVSENIENIDVMLEWLN